MIDNSRKLQIAKALDIDISEVKIKEQLVSKEEKEPQIHIYKKYIPKQENE